MSLFREMALDGVWELREAPLHWGVAEAGRVAKATDGWIAQPVPGDIHQGLIDAGRIADPLVGLNSFDCRWTEDRSWWFRRSFEVPSDWLDADRIELELNGLDSNAEIFLNGEHAGSHRNAFRPFVTDVGSSLRPGDNTLLVRLSAGVETFSEADVDAPDGVRAVTEAHNGRPERGDPRRVMVRKPQFSFGWDWGPRLATTAIGGGAVLRAMNRATIRDVALRPDLRADGSVTVTATVTVDGLHFYKTVEGTVSLTLTDTAGRRATTSKTTLLRSGLNYVDLDIPLEEPRFWWPNGLGDPHLYRVEADLQAGGDCAGFAPFDWGLRFVELDTDSTFAVVVNGKKVFCKGGNWIPADALYARVTDERYETLVRGARDCHFNMLRIWGGGLYERDAFYRYCDRYGILLWHDFMFACAPYPDHLDWFRVEVEREADYQTKRLRRHACMALWCGNNENHWGFDEWWPGKTKGGAHSYNYILPEAVRRNCPQIPYWNGSPYGGDKPNCHEVGDRHHWYDCMMNPDMNRRITPENYDWCGSLFVSEFGYVGACCPETTEAYLGGPLDRGCEAWKHHTNTFEKETIDAGIGKHYADPGDLSVAEYLRYGGLVQGLMYGYSLESMRARPECHGGLFWMYADCWGELGWTIADYYLRRKPAWYYVRRAFAPVRLILRFDLKERGTLRLVAANDTAGPVSLDLEYGYVTLDGATRDVRTLRAEVPALARREICRFGKNGRDHTAGLWYAQALSRADILPALFRGADYRDLQVSDPGLAWSVSGDGGRPTLRIATQGYAHAVSIALPAGCEAEDNYFDLLPGETRDVALRAPQGLDPSAVTVRAENTRA